ncbi:MAG: FkbM family methyltransferase [Bacteroidetes bacterium]|nr:FkbM family methyltransferase [Bacteroidota bacterium]
MNYGYSDSPILSGEKWVISNILLPKAKGDKNAFNLINVGANNGQYCDLLISLLGPQINNLNIYLLEPQEECVDTLKIKYKDFSNIYIYGIGLGEVEDKKEMYSDKKGSVQASIIKNPFSKNQIQTNISISTLDIFCKGNSIENIDCLIMDVEGYEMNVLMGAANLIRNKMIGIIQFEHGSISSIKNKKYLLDFFDILPNHDIYHIKQNGISKINYRPEFEIFYNTNYLAIIR